MRVDVRCQHCCRLLGYLDTAPDDWDGMVLLPVCPVHGGAHGNVQSWQDRQRRAGKPTDRVRVGRWVRWSDLKPAVQKARQTGQTQKHFL